MLIRNHRWYANNREDFLVNVPYSGFLMNRQTWVPTSNCGQNVSSVENLALGSEEQIGRI